MDQSLNKMLFGKDATLLEAIECCLSGAKKVAFCVDETGKLVGILTEGDILRSIKNGATLKDPVCNVINKSPLTVSESMSVPEVKKMMGRKIQIIPRIDSQGKLSGFVDMSSYEYGFLNIKDKTVLILGLGYVGLTLGLVMADRGFLIKGWDINNELLKKLKDKKPPFFETGLQDYIDTQIGRRFQILDSLDAATADVFIITVGTPVDKATKEPRLEAIQKAAKSIGKVLSRDNLVILRSTVMVGTTRNVVIPELEKASGLKAGTDFFVAFCPERTAEGRALKELQVLPQIIGGLDEKSIELASRVFNEYTPTIMRVENIEAAELCKLLDNCFRDVRFAFSNQIAEIAERLGLNIHRLIDAVNLNYGRNDIPKPSPGVGGPCLAKDTYILNKTFKDKGISAPLLMAARNVNESGPAGIVKKSDALLGRMGKSLKGSRVFIAGFAFKGEPETSDLRDSTTLWFLEELKKYTANIAGYDPVAFPDELGALGIEVVEPEAGFAGADAVFIMNNHRSYVHWDIERYIALMNRPGLFFDGWHMFASREITAMPDVMYASIGVG